MLFASFDFLLFFPVAFAGYWALAGRPIARALWLLGASYFFYMAGPAPIEGPPPTPWYFAGLLLLSTVVNYACGLGIDRGGVPKFWLLVSLSASLGMLGYFKYTGFVFQVAEDAAALFGRSAHLPAVKALLPVGISFYTFQGLSYTIDVYRRRIPVERSFAKYALFVAFFPSLVAGPIVRASGFLPQLRARPKLAREDVDFAVWRIGKGLVKKVLFGDFIAASLVDRVFAAPTEHSSLENLLALYAFTLQIYADFSGYSDIAIGTARLLGFRIPENFDRPYQSVDIADFWRRWHMTLSSWLRDYVYYPLGGSRKGPARTYVNLWLTLFLVGIWHGASWNFVIYACLQASAMVYNRFCRQRSASLAGVLGLLAVSLLSAFGVTALAVALELPDARFIGAAGGAVALFIGLLPAAERWPPLRPVHILLTVHFSVLSRVFFRAENLESARIMFGKLTSWDGLGVRDGLFRIEGLAKWLGRFPELRWAEPLAHWGLLLLLIGGFALHYTPRDRLERAAQRVIPRMPSVVLGMGLALLMAGLSLLLAGPRPNIYFVF
ncbi:MAG TPA: MBOAT family O-acyltransferase [Polyangiaceae bacterium]|nr:MBOAT family O-acyltransferase [Polyangiaceae bacterium]